MSPSVPELVESLASFVSWRRRYLRGDEKGEAQVFCERLFRAFGHEGVREAGATLEARLKKIDAKGTAFADLMWKPRCLIEMKKSGTDLSRHFRQAFAYWVQAVPNRPRYVVLCNFDEFWIYDFDRQVDAPVDIVALDDLPQRYDALTFLLPVAVAPVFGNDLVAVTREAAAAVSSVFRSLHARGVDRRLAQRFVLQCVVAMFAEDIKLLPKKSFTRAVRDARDGSEAYDLIGGLFVAMNSPGQTPAGRYSGTPYFNGGLFSTIVPMSLTEDELMKLREASNTDWSGVRPEIFGTLFEESMSAGERHAYGAHFTSQADIAKIILPTIVQPWQDRIVAASSINDLEKILLDMAVFRVLDPACGSGNFLYVAYREMRRLESEVKRAISDRRRSTGRAAQDVFSYVTTDHFFGIDRNEFAVEVAKVTMTLAKKLAADEFGDFESVLPLDDLDDVIQARDALFSPWPRADVIIGNPPYMGRRRMVDELGADYTQQLAAAYPGVGGVSDLVCYWFPIAHDALAEGGRAGFVATQAIRDGASRKASLDYLVENRGVIVDAVSVQPWSGDAVVHVCIVNWVKGAEHAPSSRILWLDDGNLRLPMQFIPASLKPTTDVRLAVPLAVNRKPKTCFQGQTTGHVEGFRLHGDQLADFDAGSHAYIYPVIGGDSLIHELAPTEFVIDVSVGDIIEAEQVAPAAMAHLRKKVLPDRLERAIGQREKNEALLAKSPRAKTNKHHERFLEFWWRHAYRRDDLIREIDKLDRYIALTIVAAVGRKSIYQFVDSSIRPDASLQVFTLSDDYSFGVLSSSLHRQWFDERCSKLKVDPRYTPTTVYDTFPWPVNPSQPRIDAVVRVSADILQLREAYLNKGITLAQQYNSLRKPGSSMLGKLHDRLDNVVMELYGFSRQDDVLAQILALNLAAAEQPGQQQSPGGARLSNTRVTSYRVTAGRPV